MSKWPCPETNLQPLQQGCGEGTLSHCFPLWTGLHWAVMRTSETNSAWHGKYAQEILAIISIIIFISWPRWDIWFTWFLSWKLKQISNAKELMTTFNNENLSWKAEKGKVGSIHAVGKINAFQWIHLWEELQKKDQWMNLFWCLKSQEPERTLCAEWLVDIWALECRQGQIHSPGDSPLGTSFLSNALDPAKWVPCPVNNL